MSDIKEIADRCRRIETRLTKFLESQGLETKVIRPAWEAGCVHITSLSCAIKDILDLIPADWDHDEEIIVYYRGQEVASLYKPKP